jgi:hypothetical protein
MGDKNNPCRDRLVQNACDTSFSAFAWIQESCLRMLSWSSRVAGARLDERAVFGRCLVKWHSSSGFELRFLWFSVLFRAMCGTRLRIRGGESSWFSLLFRALCTRPWHSSSGFELRFLWFSVLFRATCGTRLRIRGGDSVWFSLLFRALCTRLWGK